MKKVLIKFLRMNLTLSLQLSSDLLCTTNEFRTKGLNKQFHKSAHGSIHLEVDIEK